MEQQSNREYRVYTLRMWRESAQERWRFAIQQTRNTNTPQGLLSPDAIAEFLRAEMNGYSAENATCD